jgi:hypothetical protein
MQFNSVNDEFGKMSQPRWNKFQILTPLEFSKYATVVVISREQQLCLKSCLNGRHSPCYCTIYYHVWVLCCNRLTLHLKKTKLHGLSPWANYTDRATAACRRSDCQLLRIEGDTWSAWRIPRPYSRFSRQESLLFYQVAPQLYSRGWVDPVPDPQLFFW